MIRVADYIAQALAQHGIRHVFLITGGGAMHLNDAFGRCKDLEYICCHHEQACSIAAESYYRLTNRLAAVNVTSGPGGTNAITGVYGAWTDSLGMIVISGNVKWETLVRSTGLPMRQLGDQEIDIVKLVEPVTKYAEMVTDPLSIRYHLEKALHLAVSGRPGPVWLDVPMNVQSALIDPAKMKGYEVKDEPQTLSEGELDQVCRDVLDRLSKAKRPVILAGSAVRLSHGHEDFIRLIDQLGIPVTTAWNAHDVLSNDHPLYVGRPGTVGDRPGNFAVQNADFVLVLGCRLNIRQISYNWEYFARHAYKVMVDIDELELKKPTLKIDQPICADLKRFIKQCLALKPKGPTSAHAEYLRWCQERRERYPVCLPEYRKKDSPVNPYVFIDALFKELPENEVVVTANGSACVTSFQAAIVKKGQRLYTNSGCASMGYDLPGALGACIANDRKRTICLAGDGSIQMNLQELQTIVTHKLPIKIFVLNNNGYHSIRQTQQGFFPGNDIGYDSASGVDMPDFGKLAGAYGIPFTRIENHQELESSIKAAIDGEGPQMCEVMLDIEQPFSPKLSSRRLPSGKMISSPLEDLAPFLDREEFKSNMLVPLVEQ